MQPGYASLLSQRRRCAYYVPWLSLLSFIIVLAGTITWGVGTSSAIKNVDLALKALHIDVDMELTAAQKIAAVVIAGCCVLAAGMLVMSCGRSYTEFAVDRRGEPTRGSPYWMGANALVTMLWWAILVLLMFVFFTCCISLGFIVIATQVMQVADDNAETFIEMGIRHQNTTRDILQAQLGPLPDDVDPSDCPSTCLNVELMEYLIGELVCICSAEHLHTAVAYAQIAEASMVAVVAGSFLVWVGASFLLMNATADFAQARRERALLLRMQRSLAAGGGGFGAGDGGFGAGAGSGAGKAGSSSDPQAPLQQGGAAAPAHTGIELAVAAVAAYGMPPAYGNSGYADVDKVPLLKDPAQAYQQQPHPQQPHQQQQPYQQAGEQLYQYQYQGQPMAVVAERSDAPPDGGRQPVRKAPGASAL